MKPKLGQRVRVAHEMRKVWNADMNQEAWERSELKKPLEGIVTAVRMRVIMDQDTEYEEFSGRSYTYYVFGEQRQLADVTFSLYRRPIWVDLNDLEPLP